MFGFGKKPEANNPPLASSEAAATVPKIEASDEHFIVMPEEYLPKAMPGGEGGSGKKLYFIIAGAAAFLLLLSGGLYYFLFASSPAPEVAVVLPPLENTAPPASETATTTPEDLKIITNQALDSAGQSLGSIKISLPRLVANKYGESIGLTVLSVADIAVPAGTALAGGIYSPYPVGAMFDEPVVVDLTAANLSTPESRQNYYPAYLKGAVWQEIIPASVTADGWSFGLEKFPAGPISLVERLAAAASTTVDILGSAKSVPSQDTDTDGLTDEEETLLGTNVAVIDTDGDTYPDRAEIFNGYSPLSADGKLADADLFATYTNPTYGYKAPYPKKWLADSLDQTNKQVLFISATEEFFEILIEENPAKQPIVDWYRGQSPALANAQLDVSIIDGAAAVWSPDGLTVYVGRDGLVFIITYNKGQVEQINWPTFFEYFYKNFKFGNTASQTTAPAPATTTTPPSVNSAPPASALTPPLAP